MTPRILQEFTTGARVYVGGLESAHEVLEGENIGGIDVVIDCRSNVTKGRHGTVLGSNLLRARAPEWLVLSGFSPTSLRDQAMAFIPGGFP